MYNINFTVVRDELDSFFCYNKALKYVKCYN